MKKFTVLLTLVIALVSLFYFSPLGAQVTAFVNGLVFVNSATGANPSLSATGSDTNVGVLVSPKGTGNFQIAAGTAGGGHIEVKTASSPVPTCATCTMATGSSDTAGELVTGLNTNVNGFIFGQSWTNTPFCVLTNKTRASVPVVVTSFASIAITGSGVATSDTIAYTCTGRQS